VDLRRARAGRLRSPQAASRWHRQGAKSCAHTGKAIEKVNPGRKRNRFTKEFKLEAVRLLDRGAKG
jgi:hypothetical protein